MKAVDTGITHMLCCEEVCLFLPIQQHRHAQDIHTATYNRTYTAGHAHSHTGQHTHTPTIQRQVLTKPGTTMLSNGTVSADGPVAGLAPPISCCFKEARRY
eukprot:scpid90595/ scgid20616/ 